MNELLQKHGCANVFTVPEGLRELMSDITREVLRAQPPNIFDFIANYLSALIITREHGIMAVKILDDLCDCRPSITEHLDAAGFSPTQASDIAAIIQEEIEQMKPEEGNEGPYMYVPEIVRETQIVKKILQRYPIDEMMTAKVCQIARNAYRDYWYRKQLMAQTLKDVPAEPWEQAAEYTLEIYKRTNPSFNELNRATEKIQAAYKGYHVRRNLLTLKKKKPGPKVTLPGAPLDAAASRSIELGRVISIKVPSEDVSKMFDVNVLNKLGVPYDPKRMLTHILADDTNECACDPVASHHEEPLTPNSSVDPIPKSGPSRISFAPSSGFVLKQTESSKSSRVLEEHEQPGSGLKQDSEAAETEEVTEDVTERTGLDDDEGVSTVSDATSVPDAMNATDEDIDEEAV